VFSGFNEYEYVRRAIGLGVIDYLEKPITVAKIEEALRKTTDKIMKQQHYSAFKTKWEAARSELLEKATLDLLLAGSPALEKWKDVYGPGWRDVRGVTVVAFGGERRSLPERSEYRIVHATSGTERLAVVFHSETSADALREQLLEIPSTIADQTATGGTYESLSDAPRSYREATRALRYARFMGEPGWTRIEDIEGDEPLSAELSRHEEGVIVSLRTGDRDGLFKALDGFEAWAEEQKLKPDRLEEELVKLLVLGRKVVEESGQQVRYETPPHRELEKLASRESMFRWLRERLSVFLQETSERRRSAKHAAVEKALAFLEERFGQDVSLQELAEHVELNPTYFSLLFKEETGTTFIKHLTRLRMERAKEMLRAGMRVADVSEKVGYFNYRHFTEIFKKLVGATPSQYRDAHAGEPA
jgi:two-component system response regulator YesN